MSDDRLARPAHAQPPQFRCRVCRVFVDGSVLGTCPRCGLAPPSVTVLPSGRASRERLVDPRLAAVLGGLALVALVYACAP